MASCINSSSGMFRVNLSLNSTLLLVSLVLLSTILTIVMYSSQRTSKNDLCTRYGINETPDQTGVIILSVLSTIMGLLTILNFYKTFKKGPKKLKNWVLPLFYLGLTVTFIILTVIVNPQPSSDTIVNDSVVANWCLENKDSLKPVGIVGGVVLGLVIGGTFSFLSLVLEKRCTF